MRSTLDIQHFALSTFRAFGLSIALGLVFVGSATPTHAKGSATKSGSASKAGASAKATEEGFVQLFGENGSKLWRGYKAEGWPNSWKLEDGILERVSGGGDIMTTEEYADFELRLDWKISSGGNSGIMYRVSTGDSAPYVTGIECQVLDDSKHQDGKNVLTSAASLYGLYPRSELATSPVGEWNEARIIVQGNHVEHWLNGKKLVDCEIGSDDWKARLAKSKFATWPKFAKNSKGHIALQDHGDPVWYRNARIKRLDTKE